MSEPIYVGVFLDRDSRELLLSRFPPSHPTVHADHMTLAFGKEMGSRKFPIGQKMELEVLGIVVDEKCQTAIVAAKEEILRLQDGPHHHPHITMSCAEGTKPVYSNQLIPKAYASRAWTMFNPRLMLTGVVDFFPRTVAPVV